MRLALVRKRCKFVVRKRSQSCSWTPDTPGNSWSLEVVRSHRHSTTISTMLPRTPRGATTHTQRSHLSGGGVMLDQQTDVLTRPSTGSPLLGTAGTDSKDVQSHFERGRVYLSERGALADGAPPFFDSAFSGNDPHDSLNSAVFEGGSMVMSTSHAREASRHGVCKGKSSSMPHVYASLEPADDRCAVPVTSPWPSAPRPCPVTLPPPKDCTLPPALARLLRQRRPLRRNQHGG